MVTILNTGSGTASIDLDYFNPNGDLYGGPGIASLQPNASITYKQANHACPTVASGRITSDQPLAVIVRQYYSGGSGITATYNGFSAGGTTANLPLIMANNYGWYTGIAIQNLGSAATNVTVRYYPYPGFLDTATVQPNATVIFVQVGGLWGSGTWVGSARVTASDSQPIAAAVNQTTSGRMSSYSGFVNGTGLIVLPNVRNDMDGWTSGVQVQNLDSTSAQVKVRANSTETWYWIGGYKSITILPVPGIPSGSQGPATVECTNGRRIAAIVNTAGSGAGDLMMTYNGVNR